MLINTYINKSYYWSIIKIYPIIII
jgi:hypothetical protein